MIASATLERIGAFASDPSGTALEAAFIIGLCLDERFDADAVERELARIAGRYDDGMPPWEHLRRLGFGTGDAHSLSGNDDVPTLSRIDCLLESGRGLPITLGTLLIYLAEHVGQRAVGINFPGHFLVRVEDDLVDPLGMVARTESECLGLLPGRGAGYGMEGLFGDAPPAAMLLRMLNNLKYHFLSAGRLDMVLDMVDCQLKVLPGEAGLLVEKGDVWLRLGSIQSARAAFSAAESAAIASANEPVLAAVRNRLEDLAGRADQLH
jgi:regulator of sirC expression with transglutaminase-like and TPR domain